MSISDDQVRDDEPAALSVQPDSQADVLVEHAYAEAAAHTSQGALAGMATIQGEMLNFICGRWREALQTSASLLECRGDASKAINLQVDFAGRATAQYLDEAVKLMVLTGQIASDFWSPAAWRVVDFQRVAAEA